MNKMNQKLILASVYGGAVAVISEDKIPEFTKSWMGEWEEECCEDLEIEDNVAVDKDWFEDELYKYALRQIVFQEVIINDFENGLIDYEECSE